MKLTYWQQDNKLLINSCFIDISGCKAVLFTSVKFGIILLVQVLTFQISH